MAEGEKMKKWKVKLSANVLGSLFEGFSSPSWKFWRDWKSFDTLGEATVLFTAVAGVILIFRRLKK